MQVFASGTQATLVQDVSISLSEAALTTTPPAEPKYRLNSVQLILPENDMIKFLPPSAAVPFPLAPSIFFSSPAPPTLAASLLSTSPPAAIAAAPIFLHSPAVLPQAAPASLPSQSSTSKPGLLRAASPTPYLKATPFTHHSISGLSTTALKKDIPIHKATVLYTVQYYIVQCTVHFTLYN
jgi:hypothetical protein